MIFREQKKDSIVLIFRKKTTHTLYPFSLYLYIKSDKTSILVRPCSFKFKRPTFTIVCCRGQIVHLKSGGWLSYSRFSTRSAKISSYPSWFSCLRLLLKMWFSLSPLKFFCIVDYSYSTLFNASKWILLLTAAFSENFLEN